jgi:hypothetical protein
MNQDEMAFQVRCLQERLFAAIKTTARNLQELNRIERNLAHLAVSLRPSHAPLPGQGEAVEETNAQ